MPINQPVQISINKRARQHVETGLSTGVVEGINNKIRAIIRRAYGFRNPKAFMALILLCRGGMEFTPPLPAAA